MKMIKKSSKLFLVTLVIIMLLMSNISIIPTTAEISTISEYGDQKGKIIMLFLLAGILADIPITNVDHYELFHTIYLHRNQTIELINEPFISSDVVENLTRMMNSLKSKINISSSNDSLTVLYYETELLSISIGNDENYTIYLARGGNKTINNNALLSWRTAYVNISNSVTEYTIIYYNENVSDTHKIYVVTICEYDPSSNVYTQALTIANYWFKDKSVFFGDWIILPEGAYNLSEYYMLLSYGIKWLSTNVYNGGSPGYYYKGSQSNYVPQAYPQLAQALKTIANYVPSEINLEVLVGYALALDFPWVTIIIAVIAVAVGAALAYRAYYKTGGDIGTTALCFAVGAGLVFAVYGGYVYWAEMVVAEKYIYVGGLLMGGGTVAWCLI